MHFNPRTPCGVRLTTFPATTTGKAFQSTHPLRGATGGNARDTTGQDHFNPRTPCGVRRYISIIAYLFRYFNPRTPCGVRLDRAGRGCKPRGFQSTHPLRGATRLSPRCHRYVQFQSTHPLRGATSLAGAILGFLYIAIHAPLAGCDPLPRSAQTRLQHFNPRTPCGVRHDGRGVVYAAKHFNPRTPCGVRLYILCQSEARTANKGRTH